MCQFLGGAALTHPPPRSRWAPLRLLNSGAGGGWVRAVRLLAAIEPPRRVQEYSGWGKGEGHPGTTAGRGISSQPSV